MADVSINFGATKIYGVALTSKPGNEMESGYWIEWDWAGWIRRQVDYAMSLGVNMVKILGDVAMVQNGLITQATYNGRLQQFVQYAVDNGLAVYYDGCAPYGTFGTDNGTIAMTDAQIAAILVSNIGAITGVSGAPDFTSHIIGCELISEANAGFSAARVNNIYSLVKPSVPSILGVTFGYTSTMGDRSWSDSIIGSLDFLDSHACYPQVSGIGSEPTPTDVTNGPLTWYPTKDIIFGEGGCSEGDSSTDAAYTDTQIRNWMTGFFALGTMASSKVRGCSFWAVQDQGAGARLGQKYAAFDATWAPYSHRVLPAIRSTGTGALIAPTNLRVLNNRLIWNPSGCSNAWDSTKLYRDGVQIANPIYCMFDDTAAWSVQRKYEATAIAGASESALSQAFYYPPTSRPARTQL